MKKCLMKSNELDTYIKEVFGMKYELKYIRETIGGAQKGTFIIECNNNLKFILHIWDKYYDNFSEYHQEKDEFTSNSAVLFKKNSEFLKLNNISIPEIYYIDISKSIYKYEFAFVEYIDTFDLDEIVANKRFGYDKVFENIQDELFKLHQITSDKVGDFNELKADNFKCEDYIYELMKNNLEYLYVNCNNIKEYQKEIDKVIENCYSNITPRKKYSLIHWELGPNHIMVDKDSKVYLIDIDGMKFFDLEFEHSFLKIRFESFYKYFKRDDLDENRMKFYSLYHNIGSLTGAYQLLKRGYEDTEDILGMIKYNYGEILKYIDEGIKDGK